jgi:hypothetical protein
MRNLLHVLPGRPAVAIAARGVITLLLLAVVAGCRIPAAEFGTPASFGIAGPGGSPQTVLRVPNTAGYGPMGGLIAEFPRRVNATANSLNRYTVIMDALIRQAAYDAVYARQTGNYVSLFQTTPTTDAELFIDVRDQAGLPGATRPLGIGGVYGGDVVANQWHRVALVATLDASESEPRFRAYVNGQPASTLVWDTRRAEGLATNDSVKLDLTDSSMPAGALQTDGWSADPAGGTAGAGFGAGRRRTGRLPGKQTGRTAAVSRPTPPPLELPEALPVPVPSESGDIPSLFLDLALADDPGPDDGLSLDAAIDRLLAANLDIRGLRQELTQADADIITAGLRTNPLVYMDSQMIPYGSFDQERPGGPTQYDVNITLPWDVSGKRQARTVVARMARTSIEAQFQDVVRRQLDGLYRAFVDLQSARLDVLTARAALARQQGLPGPGKQSVAWDFGAEG